MKQDGTVIDTVELPMWKEGEAPATPAPAMTGGETPRGRTEMKQCPYGAGGQHIQDIAAADMDVVDAPAGNSSYTLHIAQQLYGRFGWGMFTEYAITIVRHIPKTITAVRMIMP